MANNEQSIAQPVVHKWIISALEIILLILAFYGAYTFASRELPEIKKLIVNSGPYAILVSTIIFGLLGATPIPSEPFTILLSTLYGPFWAMVSTSIGNLLSALVEYFISNRIGNAANFEAWRQKLPFGLGKFPVDSPVFLVGARVIPGYGSKFVSLISGFYRVPLLRYIWTTFIATLLGAVITAYGGYHLVGWLTQVVK
jgi:uncharacterized membrane protein YdjX (TVP38/TMEM64 family)